MKRVAEIHFATVSLAILIASTMLPLLVRAVDHNVGVKAGDWIKYGQYKITWSGNGTEPQYVTEQKKIDWFRIDVESVGGTTVTLNTTVHRNNGTRTSERGSLDVSNGTSTAVGPYILIASNLRAGDAVENETDSLTINRTITRRYAGADRKVNLLQLTAAWAGYTFTDEFRWDQSTGAMIEMYERVPDYTGVYVETSFKATETNMWSADFSETLHDNLIYIVAGIVTVAVVLAAALVLRRRKTQPAQTPPAPPDQPATTDTRQQLVAERPQNGAKRRNRPYHSHQKRHQSANGDAKVAWTNVYATFNTPRSQRRVWS